MVIGDHGVTGPSVPSHAVYPPESLFPDIDDATRLHHRMVASPVLETQLNLYLVVLQLVQVGLKSYLEKKQKQKDQGAK